MKLITQIELIKKYRNSKKTMHLAKTPILEAENHVITKHTQVYAWGYNTGGRPDGFWLSYGSSWLERTVGFNNPSFPPCCYLYEIAFKPHAKILHINTVTDLKKFDKSTPSYWLNLDYYDLNFLDYFTGQKIQTVREHKLIFENLRSKSGEALRSILINNKIIFTNAKDAKKYCKFYRKTKIPMDRLKYKDWAEVEKKYDGIIFAEYDKDNKNFMYHLWYQTLDATSGCIWNPNIISKVELLYAKRDNQMWEKIV